MFHCGQQSLGAESEPANRRTRTSLLHWLSSPRNGIVLLDLPRQPTLGASRSATQRPTGSCHSAHISLSSARTRPVAFRCRTCTAIFCARAHRPRNRSPESRDTDGRRRPSRHDRFPGITRADYRLDPGRGIAPDYPARQCQNRLSERRGPPPIQVSCGDTHITRSGHTYHQLLLRPGTAEPIAVSSRLLRSWA